ncbi:SIR2 family NAD-dependent protein deacylase (plasmid) [Rhodococcus globerulus]|uniref:SIR2 family NAD-dependent protein deacylase n=1 Tax=Rhodococcus globerulus TaxID=33008 RepID=UPI0039EB0B75
MDHVADIKEAIQQRTALIVLGTGFTAASIDDTTNCSWPGLLRSGLTYIEDNAIQPSDRILRSIAEDIEIGEHDSSSYLLTAAQKIVSELGGVGSAHFNAFMRHTIGCMNPSPTKNSLAVAIDALEIPIITTNYDQIFEQITNRHSVSWRDVRQARNALTSKGAESVVHLHGIWNDPDSIIITSTDYERILSDTGTEALRQSLGMLRTMVFVGFGAGLHDPHFSSLWSWLSQITSGATHYALCRQDELAGGIESKDHNSSLIFVPYGAEYTDLEPFIRKISPNLGKSRASDSMEDSRVVRKIAETGRISLLDRLTDRAIINRQRDDDCPVEELVVEPILLPAPPEQYVQERIKDDTIGPLVPLDEIREQSSITLVGEEQSGLTTSLIWIAIKKSEQSGSIPIFVEFTKLPSGKNPVSKAVRSALRAMGAPIRDKQPVPFDKICLVIDNTTVNSTSYLSDIIAEVSQLGLALVVYGCRPGVDLRIQREYAASSISPKPAYLGPIGLSHATELARRIDPEQAPRIARRVLAITRKERLSRTPLAIILLIVGVSNDDGWINAVSNTSFVDSFVDSLLGRGRIRDNMHSQIDSAGYSRVLESVAQKLIEDDSASISRIDLIVYLANLVKTLDWSDSPESVVEDLISKGLLVDRDGQVWFRQSVYLHIFAARAAIKDNDLLLSLRARPLYYGQIIRHYAALKRDDKELLQWAYDLIRKVDDFTPPQSGLFAGIDNQEVEENTRTIEKIAEQLDLPAANESAGEIQKGNSENCGALDSTQEIQASAVSNEVENIDRLEITVPMSSPGNGLLFALDYDDDDSILVQDVNPFPSTLLEDAPLDMQLTGLITLVSNILRDSELVLDPELKESMLTSTLSAWGRYMDIVNGSDELRQMITNIVDVIGERMNMKISRKETVTSNLIDSWSMHEAYRGISEELSTAKLRKALQRITEKPENHSAIHLMLPAYMLDNMQERAFWNGEFSKHLIENHQVKAVRIFVRVFVRSAYIESEQGSTAYRELEELLVNFYLADIRDGRFSKSVKGKVATKYRQRLRTSWARNKAVGAMTAPRALTISTSKVKAK